MYSRKMHVFVLLLLVAASSAVLDAPEDGNYDNHAELFDPQDGNDDEPVDSDDEYPDPLPENENPYLESNSLEDFDEDSDPEDREQRSYYAYRSADSFQCVTPSAESVKEGERIINLKRSLKIFPQHFLLSTAEAAAVSAYLRKHHPQALCPRPSSVKFAVPVKGQCDCFVKCDKAPKVIFVERCTNGLTFKMNGPEKFLLRLDGAKIALDSTGGNCMPLRKGDPFCDVTQGLFFATASRPVVKSHKRAGGQKTGSKSRLGRAF